MTRKLVIDYIIMKVWANYGPGATYGPLGQIFNPAPQMSSNCIPVYKINFYLHPTLFNPEHLSPMIPNTQE